MFLLDVPPVAFSIFGFEVYWYGIIYSLAVASSFVWARHVILQLPKSKSIPSSEEFDFFMLIVVISTVVSARIGHVLFFDLEYYKLHPMEFFFLRNGGLAFHGAWFGIWICSYVFCKKHKYNWKIIADVLCFSAALGIGIGRIANFVNQELCGIATSWRNAVIFSFVDGLPRHPTQIYESFFEGFLNFFAMLLTFKIKKTKSIGSGLFVAIFCIVYSFSRFIIEFFKDVPAYLYFHTISLTTGQLLSVFMLIFGVIVWIKQEGQNK